MHTHNLGKYLTIEKIVARKKKYYINFFLVSDEENFKISIEKYIRQKTFH